MPVIQGIEAVVTIEMCTWLSSSAVSLDLIFCIFLFFCERSPVCAMKAGARRMYTFFHASNFLSFRLSLSVLRGFVFANGFVFSSVRVSAARGVCLSAGARWAAKRRRSKARRLGTLPPMMHHWKKRSARVGHWKKRSVGVGSGSGSFGVRVKGRVRVEALES